MNKVYRAKESAKVNFSIEVMQWTFKYIETKSAIQPGFNKNKKKSDFDFAEFYRDVELSYQYKELACKNKKFLCREEEYFCRDKECLCRDENFFKFHIIINLKTYIDNINKLTGKATHFDNIDCFMQNDTNALYFVMDSNDVYNNFYTELNENIFNVNFASTYADSSLTCYDTLFESFLVLNENSAACRNHSEVLLKEQVEFIIGVFKVLNELYRTNLVFEIKKIDKDFYLLTGRILTKDDYIDEMLEYYKKKLETKNEQHLLPTFEQQIFTSIFEQKSYTFTNNGTPPRLAMILVSECDHFIGLELIQETFIYCNQRCSVCHKKFIVKKYFEAEVYETWC